jgi:uncharacterized protein YkwD
LTEEPIPASIGRQRRIKKARPAAALALAVFAFLASAVAVHPREPAPIPPARSQAAPPTMEEKNKARNLFRLAKGEHRRLKWDPCLAQKALSRARQLAASGVFEHEDPKTGTNPVWKLTARCYRLRNTVDFGENLSQGNNTAEKIHEALMESPKHRKNILDPRFSRLGVGCWDNICVQLFAGF